MPKPDEEFQVKTSAGTEHAPRWIHNRSNKPHRICSIECCMQLVKRISEAVFISHKWLEFLKAVCLLPLKQGDSTMKWIYASTIMWRDLIKRNFWLTYTLCRWTELVIFSHIIELVLYFTCSWSSWGEVAKVREPQTPPPTPDPLIGGQDCRLKSLRIASSYQGIKGLLRNVVWHPILKSNGSMYSGAMRFRSLTAASAEA